MKTQPVNDHYIVAPTPRTAIEQFCGEKNFPLLASTRFPLGVQQWSCRYSLPMARKLFAQQTSPDAVRTASEADFEMTLKFGIALIRLAAEDPAVHKLTLEVQHLLKPRSVYCDPDLMRRVFAKMAEA
jgi:hypothetical protein